MKMLLNQRKKLESNLKDHAKCYRGGHEGFRKWLPEASAIIQQISTIDRSIEKERQMLARVIHLALVELAAIANVNKMVPASHLASVVAKIPLEMYQEDGLDPEELKAALESYQSKRGLSNPDLPNYVQELDLVIAFEQSEIHLLGGH